MAAPQDNASTLAVQKETYFPEVPVAYERDDTVLAKIEKRGGEEDMSSRALRFAMQVRPGGKFRQTSFDNGVLGLGGATDYLVSTITPIDFVFAVQLSKKAEISTNSTKKSIINVEAREVATSLKQVRTAFDILVQGDGSGILNASPTISTTTWTLPATGPSTSWFYVGQGVNLFTSNMATKRVGTATILKIDPVAHTLLVDALPSSGVTGDVIAIEGLTAGAGLAQSLFGLNYHISSANTGTWQAVNRADYPEVRAEEYDAGGAMLALPFGRILINKIAKNLGVDFATGTGMEWLGNLDQKANLEELAQSVMIVNKGQGASQSFDGAFDIETFVGLKTNWGIHVDPTKLYAIKWKSFARGVSMPLKMYTPTGSDQTRFPVYDSGGGITASTLYYWGCSFQVGNSLPRANGVISDLAPEQGLSG
jgi:hypothetical protein